MRTPHAPLVEDYPAPEESNRLPSFVERFEMKWIDGFHRVPFVMQRNVTMAERVSTPCLFLRRYCVLGESRKTETARDATLRRPTSVFATTISMQPRDVAKSFGPRSALSLRYDLLADAGLDITVKLH